MVVKCKMHGLTIKIMTDWDTIADLREWGG
jgi:hypothetical protein